MWAVTDLEPRECDLCDCKQHQWNGRSWSLRSDPPSTCACGHETSRHRFRRIED